MLTVALRLKAEPVWQNISPSSSAPANSATHGKLLCLLLRMCICKMEHNNPSWLLPGIKKVRQETRSELGSSLEGF